MSSFRIIPFKAPEDPILVNTIRDLAKQISQSEFYSESDIFNLDPVKYKFLKEPNSVEYGYFKWIVFLDRENLDILTQSELEKNHIEKLFKCKPGFLDLTIEDYRELECKILNNNGSREHIKKFRRWITNRMHSFSAISVAMRNFIVKISRNDNPLNFDKIISTLYVIHDLLVHNTIHTTKGFYTTLCDHFDEVDVLKIMFPNLPIILKCAHKMADDEVNVSKVLKLVNLWETKGIYDSKLISVLNFGIFNDNLPPEPPVVQFTSPYLDSMAEDLKKLSHYDSFGSKTQDSLDEISRLRKNFQLNSSKSSVDLNKSEDSDDISVDIFVDDSKHAQSRVNSFNKNGEDGNNPISNKLEPLDHRIDDYYCVLNSDKNITNSRKTSINFEESPNYKMCRFN